MSATKTKVSTRRSISIDEIAKYSGHLTVAELLIKGESPLIPHRFSAKAKKMMLDKQMGVARAKEREPKKPVRDAVDALYFLDDAPEIPEDFMNLSADEVLEEMPLPFLKGARLGMTAIAFKMAAVRAGKILGHAMTDLKVSLFVHADKDDLVEIITPELPVMRADFCRVDGGKTADIRFRSQIWPWSTRIKITFNNKLLTIEQLVALFADAGQFGGIGDWRNSKSGQFGAFVVAGVGLEENKNETTPERRR